LLFGLAIVTGILAGLYPALYLSGFKPAKVLKGGQFKGKVWVRQALVVGQMVLASGLIMGAFIIHSQVAYMLEKDLGFEAQQKLVFNLNGVSNGQQVTAYRDALLRLPEVRNAAAINETPGKRLVSDILLYKSGQTMDDGDLTLMSYVDENFLKTLKIDLLAGRNFTLADTASTRGIIRVIANEAAIRKQQIPLEEAIGTVLYSEVEDLRIEATIVGVMADINYQSLLDEVRPMIMVASPASDLGFLVADVESADYTAFLTKAQTAWEQMVPELPFRYSFLDEDIAQVYHTEQTLSKIISTFTILAIIIACLGLFGLSVYAAEQRQKEISIRKVLGASIESLVIMLSREFLLLVGVALLIAVPLSYYFMQEWLANFAYQTPIYWWIFAGTAAIAIGLAFLTISFQSVRAALANPVDSLKE
jgi:putative ABC transport system permease protein